MIGDQGHYKYLNLNVFWDLLMNFYSIFAVHEIYFFKMLKIHNYLRTHIKRWNLSKNHQIFHAPILNAFSIRSSEINTIGYNNVQNWRAGLDSTQSVNHHDSESSLTNIAFGSSDNSTLNRLLNPNDSASQVNEVVSESPLQNVERVYNVNDPEVFKNLLDEPSVYSYFDIADSVYYIMSDTLLTVDPSIVNSLNVFT